MDEMHAVVSKCYAGLMKIHEQKLRFMKVVGLCCEEMKDCRYELIRNSCDVADLCVMGICVCISLLNLLKWTQLCFGRRI